MFLSKPRFALALALALSGAALAVGIHGAHAQGTLLQRSTPSYCSTNPYDPNFTMGGCGGGELALVERSTPQMYPLCDWQNAIDNPYCPNYAPREE